MKPRAVTDPIDALGATLVDLNARVRALEVVSHRHVNTFGAFHSDLDQIASVSVEQAITFEQTDLSYGISIQNSSEITIETPGTYVLAWTSQIHHTGGGGVGVVWETWLAFNGAAYPASASRVHVQNNTYATFSKQVMGQSLTPGDYVEIIWRTDNASIILESEAASPPLPLIPSVIACIWRVPGRA